MNKKFEIFCCVGLEKNHDDLDEDYGRVDGYGL
jgi:hypothetical protein